MNGESLLLSLLQEPVGNAFTASTLHFSRYELQSGDGLFTLLFHSERQIAPRYALSSPLRPSACSRAGCIFMSWTSGLDMPMGRAQPVVHEL